MKYKNIILVLILISLFMFMPSRVMAAQYCEYNVIDIKQTSAKILWNCKTGSGVNAISVYSSPDCSSNVKETNELKPVIKPGSKTGIAKNHGSFVFEGKDNSKLEQNKCYLVSYRISDNNIPWILIKTGTKGSPGKVMSATGVGYNKNLTESEADEGESPTRDWEYEAMVTRTTMKPEEIRKNLCDDDLKVLIRKIWNWITILGPIGLIILISLDLAKAIIANDADALKKSGSKALKRTIAVIVLLILPWILTVIFGIFGADGYICF